MEYKKDIMPITCGAYNSLPVPLQQGTHQAMPTQHTMTTSPMTPSQQMIPFQPITPSSFQPIAPSQQVIPALPTGMPAGTPFASSTPSMPAVPPATGVANHSSQVPVTVESTLFTPGFLRTQIGRRIRVEFLLGTNLLTDRTGTLVAVGASYILIRPIDSDDLMMCDIYSIKFATIIL